MSRFAGEDLTCIRGERLVFRGLGFAIAPGEALVLGGPNGSGKSSLLRLMAGLAIPAAGWMNWDGASIADEPDAHRARLLYVGHADPVKPALTVAENLAFWTALRTGRAAADSTVAAALAALGVERLASVPGRYLSAGQRRRVNLARLAASPVDLWLLDEPTTGLDAAAADCLRRLLAAHRAQGGMVVVSTHVDLGLDGVRRLALDDAAAGMSA
jgi:heme exporter protein A